jgi:hypothetical protein
MISRRRLIQVGATAAGSSAIGAGATASSRIVSGAIRWDAWRDNEHRAAVNYVNDNPAVCPSTALLIQSWNGCDEGGCDEGGSELCRSLGDPPPSAILAAIEPVLS